MPTILKASFLAALLLLTVGCEDDPDSDSIPDPDCDALLTPADFQAVCGAEVILTPTAFEGIELNPCNRSAPDNEAILLVSRHTSASVAQSGAEVAGGRGPNLQTDLHVSAGSAGIFVVEVKARDDAAAICSPDKLPLLLDIALARTLP